MRLCIQWMILNRQKSEGWGQHSVGRGFTCSLPSLEGIVDNTGWPISLVDLSKDMRTNSFRSVMWFICCRSWAWRWFSCFLRVSVVWRPHEYLSEDILLESCMLRCSHSWLLSFNVLWFIFLHPEKKTNEVDKLKNNNTNIAILNDVWLTFSR